MLLIATAANVAGYLFNLYDRVPWFDKALHAYTLFALTLAVAFLLYGRVLVSPAAHPVAFILALTGIGLGLGGLWEIAEWAFDQVVLGDIIKGKEDTITDLIVDTVGALVAAVLSKALLGRSAGTPEATSKPNAA